MNLGRLTALVALGALLGVVSPVKAEHFEYKQYVVKRGDTLWDISRANMEDSFQWPLIWRENQRINNPDLIYPGQVITIPVRVLSQDSVSVKATQEPASETGAETPAQTEAEATRKDGQDLEVTTLKPLITREALLESGYITKDVPRVGRITGAMRGETLYGTGSRIYIETDRPTEVGQKFYVIRKEAKVKHPETGKFLGWLVRVRGTVVAEEAGTKRLKARVTEAFDSIVEGDVLDDYYEVLPPFLTGEARTPQVGGYVVASKYKKRLNGQFEAVFIDKGKEDQLQEGDLLMTLFPGTDDRRNSVIQLVNVRESTSLALIKESRNEVKKGDEVSGLAR